MVDICFTYFRSLTLKNLEAALHSLRQQDFSRVNALYVLDNNTADSPDSIQEVVFNQGFPIPVVVQSVKHGDSSRTHSWSTNTVVRLARAPFVFFTRADYILDHDIIKKYLALASPTSFVTGDVYHLHVGLPECEKTTWRGNSQQLQQLPGTRASYTVIDTGVWLTSAEAFHSVGGLDEGLTAWGHAQTHFQWKLHQAGVEFHRIPEVLFYHPTHGGEKDLTLAHQQLAARGFDIKELWRRYEGEQPYR